MTKDPAGFRIHALELGPMENFIYFIEDLKTQRTAIVDPAWEVNEILDFSKQNDLKVTDILLTHSHSDHINGINGVLDQYDAQLHLLKSETQLWRSFADSDMSASSELHHGGDRIILGETTIEILHTPGHTPGSACYHIGNDLIAGDTLFVFGCGRCDLAGGDPGQMFHTLKKIQAELPAATLIHPGHNYSQKTTATLQEQIDGNPFFHFDDEHEFTHYRMHEHDKVRDSPYGPVPRATK
ncbi:MAG: MBL fold metallo-hydrolase [Thiohalomonadales bacterium]